MNWRAFLKDPGSLKLMQFECKGWRTVRIMHRARKGEGTLGMTSLPRW